MQTLLRASVPFGRCSLLSYRKYSTQPASILKPPPAPNTNARTLAKELSGKNLINGELQSSAHLNTLKISHPATGEVFGHVPRGRAEDVAAAVASAKLAQKEWAKTPARQRGALVAQCGALLKNHAEELAQLTTLETGKAIRTESRVEANVVADMFTFYGGLGSELKGEVVPFSPDNYTFTVREPVGVVGAIVPWNAPLLLMALKVAPALVAGNSVVVKTPEEAPFGILRVCQIFNSLLPRGLFSVVSGLGAEAGAALVKHPDVKKVSFTGSVETGKAVYREAADKLGMVTLELGGKSPMIIAADADLAKAVEGAFVSMRFTRQGQSCTAASRIFVHEKLHDEFIARLRHRIDGAIMGDPFDEKTDIGTVISKRQYDKIKQYIQIGKSHSGVKAYECSALPTDPKLSKGLFVQPVLFTHIDSSSPVVQEEIFGPVTAIMKWSNQDQVLDAANSSRFGLSASVWTNDMKFALRATQRLEAGIVQVNQNLVVQPNLPFGGFKESGLGKEASLEAMLEHYTMRKTIALNMS